MCASEALVEAAIAYSMTLKAYTNIWARIISIFLVSHQDLAIRGNLPKVSANVSELTVHTALRGWNGPWDSKRKDEIVFVL